MGGFDNTVYITTLCNLPLSEYQVPAWDADLGLGMVDPMYVVGGCWENEG